MTRRRRRASPAILLVLAAAVIALFTEATGVTMPLAMSLYDGQLRFRRGSEWPSDLVVAPVDEAAIRALGRWPWPRDRIAETLERLRALGARTLVLDVFLEGAGSPDGDARLAEALDGAVLAAPPRRESPPEDAELARIRESLIRLPAGSIRWNDPLPLTAPDPAFTERAARLGHSKLYRTVDGRVRAHTPLLPVEGLDGFFPSLALAAYIEHWKIPTRRMEVDGNRLSWPGGRLPPIHSGEMLLDFVPAADGLPGESGGPARVRLADVFDPAHEAKLRRNLDGKLVLFYIQAGTADKAPTPISEQTPGGLIQAYAIRTMAHGRAPQAVPLVPVIGALLCLILLLGPWLVRRNATTVLAFSFFFIAAYLGAGLVLVRLGDLFLPVATPVPFLGLSGVFLAARAHFGLRMMNRRATERLRTAPASGDASAAPAGTICLVFSDIEGSTSLWERSDRAMLKALEVHDATLRRTLREHRGYEVKTEGDAFMVAFHSVDDAVRWTIAAQEALLASAWPETILSQPETLTELDPGSRPIQRGLRVRMGIHVGEAECRPNPLTGRMDYYGPIVNRAAQIASTAHGGQILASTEVAREIERRLSDVGNPIFEPLGQYAFKGIADPVPLFQILPASLSSRTFRPPRSASPAG